MEDVTIESRTLDGRVSYHTLSSGERQEFPTGSRRDMCFEVSELVPATSWLAA